MEMHWLYKHGPYEITEAYTIICSRELSIQSVTLHLQYKSHLLKGTIQTALPLGELYTLGNAAT